MNKNVDIRYVAAGLWVLAVVLRFVPHFYNVSAIGAMGMFVGCYWSARMGMLMALSAMGVSDLLGHWFGMLGMPSMGFYSVGLMLVVYGAMGCSGLVGKLLQRRVNWVTVPLGAIAATLVFFLTTNFASWLDPQMPYARTPAGLLECYIAAIPFVKNTLYGNLLYSALFFGGYIGLTSTAPARERSRVE